MTKPRILPLAIGLVLIAAAFYLRGPAVGLAGSFFGVRAPGTAAMKGGAGMKSVKMDAQTMLKRRTTPQMRLDAAKRAAQKRDANPLNSLTQQFKSLVGIQAVFDPRGTPDYFGGVVPNWAFSPFPELDTSGNVIPGTGIRKFIHALPGLGPSKANNLGNYLPVATPDTTTYPGSDYYVIALVEYTQKLHADLPPTRLRGYCQLNTSENATIAPPSYLGPTIVARKNRPVRVKFINKLPTGTGGNLFIPTDTTVMGAGAGPQGGSYTQNRATLHLHGGNTPWISDGTPHQWITPAGENTPYPKGVSVRNVPDMADPGPGAMTFYYSNQQSARLMFYHDHALGITRLNVYAGEAAGYLLGDTVDDTLVNGGTLNVPGVGPYPVQPATVPTEQVPLVIQDKTFVPKDAALVNQDPTWDKAGWGSFGSLWFPHVYMPNQNPYDPNGVNAMGRWDYGPLFYPPMIPQFGLTPAGNPGTPNPSIVPEAFLDTPIVNGTPYPYLKVQRKAYRFRILNACNDRFLNLQIYFAKSNTIDSVDTTGNPTLQTASGEVSMTPAAPHADDPTWPASWPKDGRDGGVPDPHVAGPEMVQIGTEGGFLPNAVVLPNQPVSYVQDRKVAILLNVDAKTLFLGPAERADVIVDFSQVPAGSKLILYNDAPAPVPAFDPRNDYYTGSPDLTAVGGAPSTRAGYGPNTRTVMQFQVEGASAAPQFDLARLQAALPNAFKAGQDTPIVKQQAYGGTKDTYVKLQDTSITVGPPSNPTTITMPFQKKTIFEYFEAEYGRMNATLGVELPFTNILNPTAIPLGYIDPATEEVKTTAVGTPLGTAADGTQFWRITHNGVDTHAIHWHKYDVQVINRVGIDGAIAGPDDNEQGWKDTLRMNPLQDVIVALRPLPLSLPFKLGDSIRPLDPTQPLGATARFSTVDASGNPTTTVNQLVNYGWEYVWHCHLLGHEENDMMRAVMLRVSPPAPSNLGVSVSPPGSANPTATVSWTNHNVVNPAATSLTIQRATNNAFTSGVTTFTVNTTQTTSYADGSVAGGTYFYRVRAENAVSYSEWSNTATATITPAVVINSAAFSNPVAYKIASLLTTKMVATFDQSNVNVRIDVTTPSGPWTIFNAPIANTAGVPFTFPAWNGKHPTTGASVPYAANYSWTMTVTKNGATATKTGGLIICNVYFQRGGTTNGGATATYTGYLSGSAAAPMSVNLYLSATAATAGTLGVRVTGPAAYNFVPAGTPWAIGPAAPPPATARLTGAAAVRANGTYTFAVTPTVTSTYKITVVE